MRVREEVEVGEGRGRLLVVRRVCVAWGFGDGVQDACGASTGFQVLSARFLARRFFLKKTSGQTVNGHGGLFMIRECGVVHGV